MLWNPFQFQYTTTYLSDEGENAIVELRKGTHVETVRLPKALLPAQLTPGNTFNLKIEDNETAKKSELQTLQHLLSELIK